MLLKKIINNIIILFNSIISTKILEFAKKIYNSIIEDKDKIRMDNSKKSGIYCLVNKINNKLYVGRSKDIRKRFNVYLSPYYYKNPKFSLIKRSIIKYGLINFSFIILEYISKDDLIYMRKREQY
jgi:hypothetical protein